MKTAIKTKIASIALTAVMAVTVVPVTAIDSLASAPEPNPNTAVGDSLVDEGTRTVLTDLFDTATAFIVLHYDELPDDVRIYLDSMRTHAYQVLMHGGYEGHYGSIGELRTALNIAQASLNGTQPDPNATPFLVVGTEAYNRTQPVLVSTDIANTTAYIYANTRNLPPEMVRTLIINNFVERIYLAALGRNTDTAGRDYWTNSIISGERTADDVIITILQSREFVGRDLSDEAYVTALYKVFFDRTPDTQGLNNWVNALRSGAVTREGLVRVFTTTPEWANICSYYGL